MVTALASQPGRATTSITLAWGLLSIPLSVYTGVEETRVKRSEFVRSEFVKNKLVPVGRTPVRKDNGEVIEADEVVRLAEADNGCWVELTDDEIAQCTSPRGLAEIASFVKVKDAGSYLVQDVKQVRPKRTKGKADLAAERALALLLAGMAKRKVMALVKVAMRGPARYALLDASGSLFLIATADAVRNPLPAPEAKVTAAELDMALALIDAVGVDAPVLTDDTAPVVQKFVNGKASGMTPPPPPEAPAMDADIMSQLQASIDAAKVKKGKVA